MSRSPNADFQWFVVQRSQQFDAENHINLLRLVGIGVFYSIHLANHYWIADRSDGFEPQFHRMITLVVMAWMFMAGTILFCLRKRVFPPYLKYLSMVVDVALLTAVASLGEKAHSPLVILYGLLIALNTLQFSLPLIWAATGSCLVGYLTLVGATDQKWFDNQHDVPLIRQFITLSGIIMTGIFCGQIIRRSRRMAEQFLARKLARSSDSQEP